MQNYKRLQAVTLFTFIMRLNLFILLLLLTSCKVKESVITGTWVSNTYYETDTITFAKDNTVAITLYRKKHGTDNPMDTILTNANWQLKGRHITLTYGHNVQMLFGNCGGLDVWTRKFKKVLVRGANCNEPSNRFVMYKKTQSRQAKYSGT